jgi:hypothetical protein
LLIAAEDAKDDENFLTEKVDRIDLGPLKGNDGDQNYVLPAGIDLTTYKAVAFFCGVSMPTSERYRSKSRSPRA